MRHRVPLKVPSLSRNQFLKLNPSLCSPLVKEPFRSCSGTQEKMLTCHREDMAREEKIREKKSWSLSSCFFDRNWIDQSKKKKMHLTLLQVYIIFQSQQQDILKNFLRPKRFCVESNNTNNNKNIEKRIRVSPSPFTGKLLESDEGSPARINVWLYTGGAINPALVCTLARC